MQTIDFRGFRFGNTHTSDLNLEVVSSSNRYEVRTLPTPNDYAEEIPGSDGSYYFGQNYKDREISVDVAFDNVSEEIYRKIRQLFANDKLQDLVFDEEPYKTWRAKVKSAPEFKSLCFTNKETGQRVYKGEGSLTFICYYPYAFGFDKYVVRSADYYMLNPPECIIAESQKDNFFVKNKKEKNYGRILPPEIKYHYNANPSDYEGGDTDDNIEDHKLRDKSHRNRGDYYWEPNDEQSWKTGFPTYEQVEAGELYFDTPDGEKAIVDVRGYWDNVPEWQSTAKLLTTPTLDYEQELMYLPQYSKTDFVNMETGFHHEKGLIGTRMLVYNPGDLPVDWEIKFNENKRGFWTGRGGEHFRIRRFNVERLTIPQAVDWTHLKTFDPADEEGFKYGTKYFRRKYFNVENVKKRLSKLSTLNEEDRKYAAENYRLPANKTWDEGTYNYINWKDETVGNLSKRDFQVAYNLSLDSYSNIFSEDDIEYRLLGKAHPHHCYIVEPIPRELLGHFIKLFYWQTCQWRGTPLKTPKKLWYDEPEQKWGGRDRWIDMMPDEFWKNKDELIVNVEHPLVNWVRMMVQIDEGTGKIGKYFDYHRNKLADISYEDGIKIADRYDELYKGCITDEERFELYWQTLETAILRVYDRMIDYNQLGDYTIEDFIYEYIHRPMQYLSTDTRDLDYGQEILNAFKTPQWITQDYMEIDQSALTESKLLEEYFTEVGEGSGLPYVGVTVEYDPTLLKNNLSLKAKVETYVSEGMYVNDILPDYYYLNSESRMLYTTKNPYGMEFVYKPEKVISNDAIVKGKWFKLPPGWSLITVEPIVDESTFGGKRWLDARPFDWGYGGDVNRNQREASQLFEYINTNLVLPKFYKENKFLRVDPLKPNDTVLEGKYKAVALLPHNPTNPNHLTPSVDDDLLKFRLWWDDRLYSIEDGNSETEKGFDYLTYSIIKNWQVEAEYHYLRLIDEYWQLYSPLFAWTAMKGVRYVPIQNPTEYESDIEFDANGHPLRMITGKRDDWFWYACNYTWANFPPIYWGLFDMLNEMKIKYTPLFY